MTKTTLAFAIATVAILASASAAMAVSLKSVRDTAIYDSPQMTIWVGTMPNGAVYEGYCEQVWCHVSGPGGTGWVIGTDLQFAQGQQAQPQPQQQPQPQPQPQPQQQQPNLGLNFGIDIFGGDDSDNRPNRRPVFEEPEDDAQVCFFDSNNFKGKSFCVGEGEFDDQLPTSWDNRISSITVDDGLTVEICRNAEMAGTCGRANQDVSRLPAQLNNRVTSYEVTAD